MQKRRLWGYGTFMLLAGLIATGGVSTVAAVSSTSNSANYQVTETQFGAGSTAQSCSSQYCAKASIGDMASGSSKGATTSATFGTPIDNQPLLEVIVGTSSSDLGDLDTTRTATQTMSVKIRTYLSSGYTLQIVGNPPQYGNHSLSTPSTPTASQPGTEQFAINLAANSSPGVGAAAVQVPDSQTSFGVVNDNYKTPDQFKYASGDTVAHSSSASGETDYTVSMIINIANTTPAGHYSGDFSAVVVPVY